MVSVDRDMDAVIIQHILKHRLGIVGACDLDMLEGETLYISRIDGSSAHLREVIHHDRLARLSLRFREEVDLYVLKHDVLDVALW